MDVRSLGRPARFIFGYKPCLAGPKAEIKSNVQSSAIYWQQRFMVDYVYRCSHFMGVFQGAKYSLCPACIRIDVWF